MAKLRGAFVQILVVNAPKMRASELQFFTTFLRFKILTATNMKMAAASLLWLLMLTLCQAI
jgi:hypothetical protein